MKRLSLIILLACLILASCEKDGEKAERINVTSSDFNVKGNKITLPGDSAVYSFEVDKDFVNFGDNCNYQFCNVEDTSAYHLQNNNRISGGWFLGELHGRELTITVSENNSGESRSVSISLWNPQCNNGQIELIQRSE